jgi:hypothetical protein
VCRNPLLGDDSWKENPSACARVNWKVCISAIALYCLCVSVTKRERVTLCICASTNNHSPYSGSEMERRS